MVLIIALKKKVSRPCKRCSALGKCDTCIDIKHKKRGRPKLTTGSSSPKKVVKDLEVPTTPPNNLTAFIPIIAPGLSACSFSMTQLIENQHISQPMEERLRPSDMMTVSVVLFSHTHEGEKLKIIRFFFRWIYVAHAYQMNQWSF